MQCFSNALIVVLAAIFSTVAAQSTLPPCSRECHKLRGQCNVSLFELSRTPCFDTRTNQERTCDCGIRTLRDLANFGKGKTLHDCVFSQRLLNLNSDITIEAKLDNVHGLGIFNVGALQHKGDIILSTLCEWKCVGRNRFKNCVMTGNVVRSTLNLMSAEQDATLSITGPKFDRNNVRFIRTDKDIQIGCKEGFDSNKVSILATPSSGRFSTLSGTSFAKNQFDQIALGKVNSFAEFEDNTAKIATAEGPCIVQNRGSQIKVIDALLIPNDQCQRLFKKVLV